MSAGVVRRFTKARALAWALVSASVVALGVSRAGADDPTGAGSLKDVLAHVEAAQKVAVDKEVASVLDQAHDATVGALKLGDRSDAALEGARTARKLLQSIVGRPKVGGPEVRGHVIKAVGFLDAYLTPVGTGQKPGPIRPPKPPSPKPPEPPPTHPVGPTVPGPDPVPAPARGRFRVWLNGFTVNNPTFEGAFEALDPQGVGDEVALISSSVTVDAAGIVRSYMWGMTRTGTMGAQPPNAVHAGFRTTNGGLKRGDSFPTETPWIRTGDGGAIPPTKLFEGELVEGGRAAVILPTIWEWDGVDGGGLERAYADALDRDRAAIGRAIAGRLTRPARTPEGRPFLVPGWDLGMTSTLTLDAGFPANRPIGMQGPLDRRQALHFGFFPNALVLTHDTATRIIAGVGVRRPGIVEMRYRDDDRWMEGDYTLFLEVERVGMERPCPEPISSTMSARATLTTTHGGEGDRARGPFVRDGIDVSFRFTECRSSVQVTVPPISNPPFDVELPTGAIYTNTTTVTQVSGGVGSFDPGTGRFEVPITLVFTHSVETDGGPDPANPSGPHRGGLGRVLAGPSTISVTLTTEAAASGSPRGGEVVLTGTGRFMNGYLGGSDGTITVRGTLSPAP